MLKKISVLVVAIFISTQLFAEEGRVSFGLEVTPAISWLNIDHPQIDSDGSSLKLNGGLIININMGETYAIVTGLRYNSHGGSLKGIDSTSVKYEFNEFEIPIGLKLRTGSFGKMRFAAHLSTGLGIPIKPKETYGFYENEKIRDFNLLPVRALYNLGAGVEYDLGAVILTGKISYKGWFSNLYFYKNKINLPSDQLELIDSNAKTYTQTIIFQPSAVELSFGVIF